MFKSRLQLGTTCHHPQTIFGFQHLGCSEYPQVVEADHIRGANAGSHLSIAADLNLSAVCVRNGLVTPRHTIMRMGPNDAPRNQLQSVFKIESQNSFLTNYEHLKLEFLGSESAKY